MIREIIEYTMENDRSATWEGTFENTDNINVGDYIIGHGICKTQNVCIVYEVCDKKVAYYINGKPVYDYITKGGSSMQATWKHVSIHDRIVK